ncbi:hypothetical protein LTS08_007789 [Lithohypha guttulata]|nr:hypothetical protein LTS08_007789 [Lithohypha guttulata]
MIATTLLLAASAAAIALPPPTVDFQALLQTQDAPQPLFQHTSRQSSHVADDDDEDPIPVIIWHGLGDASNADGLSEVADLIDHVHPGTYVHIISANGNADDRSASFFGDLNTQIDLVCKTLASDPILSTAPAVDAMGFSQGGQFLRGYIERCNEPKVRNFITFGSQHNGITQFERCKSATDFICHAANALLKSSTVWSDYVQTHLIPAQYYRDKNDFDNYLEHSHFLADINNERKTKNSTYKENLSKLENFVMIVFEDDQAVIPKESGWFASVNETESNRTVTKLQDRPIYKEDWIGLRQLDEKGSLKFLEVDGEHMQLNNTDLKKLFKSYFGPERSNKSPVEPTVDEIVDVLGEWFVEKLDL